MLVRGSVRQDGARRHGGGARLGGDHVRIGTRLAIAASLAVASLAVAVPARANSPSWDQLPGALQHVDQIEAARNADGRLEVFTRGILAGVSGLFHRGQLPDGSWSGWAPLGGTDYGQFVVVNQANGRLQVFQAGRPKVTSIAQNMDGTWGQWTSFGASSGARESVAAVRDQFGQLHVIAGSDGHRTIMQMDQIGPNQIWLTTGSAALTNPYQTLLMGLNADGRAEALMTLGGGEVQHRRQVSDASWSAWASLATPGRISSMAVTNLPDGTLEAYAVVDANSAVWTIAQNGPGSWDSAWQAVSLPGLGQEVRWSALHTARNADGTPELYLRVAGGTPVDNSGQMTVYRYRMFGAGAPTLTKLDHALPDRVSQFYFTSAVDLQGRLWVFSFGLGSAGAQVIYQHQVSAGRW
jgi:hypothetical protein